MKLRPIQFETPENTASSRQHSSHLATDLLPSMSETLPNNLRHRQTRPVSASCTNDPIAKPLDAATRGEKGDNVETAPTPPTVIAANNSRHVFEPLIGCEEAARLLGNIHVKTL